MDRPSHLRALRLLAGLTQWDLGQQLGKSQAYVAALESGRRSPSFDEVVALSIAFDMPIGALVPTLRPVEPGEPAPLSLDSELCVDADDRAAADLAGALLQNLRKRLAPEGTLILTLWPNGQCVVSTVPIARDVRYPKKPTKERQSHARS